MKADQAYWSDATVVAASRAWVCIRLATYEDAEEGELLFSFFRGRGALENTTIVLLGPDGRQRLSEAGRGPAWLLPGAARGPDATTSEAEVRRFAALLEEKARAYRARPSPSALPLAIDVRRGLNVASCDGQPLVLVRASSAARQEALEKRLAALAWSEAFLGRVQYVRVRERTELDVIDGAPAGDGFVVVQPDRFGLEGTVLARAGAEASAAALGRMLADGLARFDRPAKEARRHIADGHRAGASWTSEIPVTDPQARPRR